MKYRLDIGCKKELFIWRYEAPNITTFICRFGGKKEDAIKLVNELNSYLEIISKCTMCDKEIATYRRYIKINDNVNTCLSCHDILEEKARKYDQLSK